MDPGTDESPAESAVNLLALLWKEGSFAISAATGAGGFGLL
jgi:hypothetical protein